MKKETQGILKSRKAAVLAVALAASTLMTACGKEYLKDIQASDYVTLGNYLGIEASADEPVVEDGMVDAYFSYYVLPQVSAEEVTGRAIEEGDTVNIDFVGYLDGEAFEGGTGSDYELTIGAHQFIDGFESGLIGVNVGETVSLNLAFPDPYENNPDLSGAPVVFEVTVNSIGRKDIDSYVQALGIEGCNTEADYRDYLYNAFYDSAVQTYNQTIESTLTNTIMADCTFKEPPAKMVKRYAEDLERAMSAQAEAYGMTLAALMQGYYGMDEAAYKEQFQAEALTEVQQYIMYQAIADAEGLNVTDEQLQEEIDSRVEAYGYESEKDYRENADVEMLREWIMGRNVLEFLKENGNITMIPATDAED